MGLNEGSMDEELLDEVRESLATYGIASSWTPEFDEHAFDYRAIITRGRLRQTYAVVVKSQITLAAIAGIDHRWTPLPILVVGWRISARSADALHDAGIQYVDAAGNAYLSFGDVYVDVRGRRPTHSGNEPASRASAAVNLFSARRAQVICALLTWPRLVHARVKDLAEAAGVSVGQAHETVGQLEHAGFVGPGGLRRQHDLLELWAAAYAAGLGSKLELGRFVGDPSPERVIGTDITAAPAISGEAAVGDLLGRRLTLTAYVNRFEPGLIIANRWRRDSEVRPNIFVRRRFWSSDPAEDEYDAEGQLLAPWPIVYADLLATGNPRLSEIAQVWRDRHEA